MQKSKEMSINIPANVKAEMVRFGKELIMEADRQEGEFLFPFLMDNAEPKIKGSVKPKKLKVRGIKRVFKEDTFEVWYEQRGKVITPSFFRDPTALLKSFHEADRG